MTAGELDTRVEIKPFTVTQNSEGDLVLTPVTSWHKWAKIEQNSGNLLISNGMTNFNESYKITMRFEVSRPTKPNYEIDYKGKKMKIYNAYPEKEGKAVWEIINAYTSN